MQHLFSRQKEDESRNNLLLLWVPALPPLDLFIYSKITGPPTSLHRCIKALYKDQLPITTKNKKLKSIVPPVKRSTIWPQLCK